MTNGSVGGFIWEIKLIQSCTLRAILCQAVYKKLQSAKETVFFSNPYSVRCLKLLLNFEYSMVFLYLTA